MTNSLYICIQVIKYLVSFRKSAIDRFIIQACERKFILSCCIFFCYSFSIHNLSVMFSIYFVFLPSYDYTWIHMVNVLLSISGFWGGSLLAYGGASQNGRWHFRVPQGMPGFMLFQYLFFELIWKNEIILCFAIRIKWQFYKTFSSGLKDIVWTSEQHGDETRWFLCRWVYPILLQEVLFMFYLRI